MSPTWQGDIGASRRHGCRKRKLRPHISHPDKLINIQKQSPVTYFYSKVTFPSRLPSNTTEYSNTRALVVVVVGGALLFKIRTMVLNLND